MKRMFSEEELLEVSNTENLVDSKGRNRFMMENGNPAKFSGLSILSSKWTLNGNNLLFEIVGVTTKNIPSNTLICTFNLPVWVANKIIQISSNIVDIPEYNLVTGDGGRTTTTLLISRNNSEIAFKTMNGITFPESEHQAFFKFTYSAVIDNE